MLWGSFRRYGRPGRRLAGRAPGARRRGSSPDSPSDTYRRQLMVSRKIVLLMVAPPLPFGKAMGRWYSVLLKGLVERGHRVRAFATCETREEAEKAEAL